MKLVQSVKHTYRQQLYYIGQPAVTSAQNIRRTLLFVFISINSIENYFLGVSDRGSLSRMDKLRKVLSGNDQTEEERGIMNEVGNTIDLERTQKTSGR